MHNYLKVALMPKRKALPKNINILSFNVETLKPKLKDRNFFELMKDNGASIFSETWKADTCKLNIEGFWDYPQVKPKHKNAIGHSVGITIFAKHNIQSEPKIVENSEGLFWVRLEKSLFNLANDIFFSCLYFTKKYNANYAF